MVLSMDPYKPINCHKCSAEQVCLNSAEKIQFCWFLCKQSHKMLKISWNWRFPKFPKIPTPSKFPKLSTESFQNSRKLSSPLHPYLSQMSLKNPFGKVLFLVTWLFLTKWKLVYWPSFWNDKCFQHFFRWFMIILGADYRLYRYGDYTDMVQVSCLNSLGKAIFRIRQPLCTNGSQKYLLHNKC